MTRRQRSVFVEAAIHILITSARVQIGGKTQNVRLKIKAKNNQFVPFNRSRLPAGRTMHA